LLRRDCIGRRARRIGVSRWPRVALLRPTHDRHMNVARRRPGTRWRWLMRSVTSGCTAISAGRATAGGWRAELSRASLALAPGARASRVSQAGVSKALASGQIERAAFPTRPARMSNPLRRWLSPSSARKRRPKPINAASVSDLTGSVHVSFPQHFPPMTRRRRSLSKPREAFVTGGTRIGEKQEQNKNKIGLPTKISCAGWGERARGSEAFQRP
jgi:hypothetical protein